MATKSLTLGIGDVHLMGKILNIADDDSSVGLYLTTLEKVRLEALWETLEAHLDQHVGPDWDEEEVQ
jgi:hypothetical protein